MMDLTMVISKDGVKVCEASGYVENGYEIAVKAYNKLGITFENDQQVKELGYTHSIYIWDKNPIS